MSTQRTGHLERTAQEPRNEVLHEVTLRRITQVNERVRLFQLTPQSGPVSFLPGQWLDTYIPGIPKPGGFTVTSSPSAVLPASKERYLELAVQESPENPAAAWLWRPAEDIVRSTLRVRVGGSFVFPPVGEVGSKDVGKVVFVAGGVGINPLMSMMSAMAEEGRYGSAEVSVLYASKVPKEGVKEILFLRRIAKLFDDGGLRGRLQLFATGVSLPGIASLGDELQQDFLKAGLEIHARRLSHDDLRLAVGEDGKATCIVYVCGPPMMTDELVQLLISPEGIGLEESQVKTEKWW
ncbi:hypothetical protein BGZ63DRAFT_426794 [Mariannaea sp. PMI_226]|nr:hypothetical protein BGZ63DRAFT_426794 [Mariannaea sp. PMI_226]